MKRKPLTLLLLVLGVLATPAYAQKKGYSKGYVITFKGDTLQGLLKDRSSGSFMELYTKIRFKSKKPRRKRKFGADDIQGYGFKDQYFESVPLQEEASFFKFRYYTNNSSKRVFLKVIEKNQYLTYYHWEFVQDDNSYLDYVPLFHLHKKNEMARVTQGIFGLKRKRLAAYFQDCPELVNGIKRKELNTALEVFTFYTDTCSATKLLTKN